EAWGRRLEAAPLGNHPADGRRSGNVLRLTLNRRKRTPEEMRAPRRGEERTRTAMMVGITVNALVQGKEGRWGRKGKRVASCGFEKILRAPPTERALRLPITV
ncbi:hypothetical protein NDU88_002805, partial [Pleurodeles waltl]